MRSNFLNLITSVCFSGIAMLYIYKRDAKTYYSLQGNERIEIESAEYNQIRSSKEMKINFSLITLTGLAAFGFCFGILKKLEHP